MTARMEQITRMIEDYATDSHMDGYHQGYDESWDEARDKGFDEGYATGYQQALDNVMEVVDRTGFVMTPESEDECSSMIESFSDNGPLCVMIYMNFLAARIKEMEE